MLKRSKLCVEILIWGILLVGCKRDNISTSRTETMVLVYIAANNNLRNDAISTVNKLVHAYKKGDNCLLLFIKTNQTWSYLIKVSDTDKCDTVKSYNNINSSDPNMLARVIHDSRQISPANKYGLIMWSHATSWLPPSSPNLKSFGYDDGKEMDIRDLKNALPNDFFYIMFDACYMGSIETVYELKNKANYILASPSEILSTSFPYHLITPYLLGDLEELKTVCKKYIDYYASLSGKWASATVCLIDTKELYQLALETAKLWPFLQRENFKHASLQRMDFDPDTAKVKVYDFLSFVVQGFSSDQYSKVKDQLSRAVLYSNHTKFFFDTPIEVFCGLGVFIPESTSNLHPYYQELLWTKDSGWNYLF